MINSTSLFRPYLQLFSR